MSIWNKNTLIAALAIQVAAVAVLIAVKSGGAVEPDPFIEFDADAVDMLSVSGGAGGSGEGDEGSEGNVVLAKKDDAWQLPDGLPADAAKVDEVIKKLADASAGWPVATSVSVQERFELVEDNHQRRLTLSAGGETVADIYLGTSPGYRKTHARRVDDDNIYAITFSNYQAGMKESDWLDKALLRPDGALTGLRYDSAFAEPPAPVFALTKNEEGVWAAASGAALDQAKVETLAGRFTGLTVTDVSDVAAEEVLAEVSEEVAEDGAEPSEEGGDDAAAADAAAAAAEDEPKTPVKMVFALADDAGAATLTIRRMDDGDYLAASDRLPGVYKLSSYIAEQMHKTLADLAPDEPAAQATGEDAGEEGEASAVTAAEASSANDEAAPAPAATDAP